MKDGGENAEDERKNIKEKRKGKKIKGKNKGNIEILFPPSTHESDEKEIKDREGKRRN